MIKVEINFWELTRMYQENEELYDKFLSYPETSFKDYPRNTKALDDKGQKKLDGYHSAKFYVNDFRALDERLWQYCTFKPLEQLEMMGGGRINSKNVFEAAQRNQIMLPNSQLYDLKELIIHEDQCTDRINDLLQEGWKIIAVLPQHGQRRPDYILGK